MENPEWRYMDVLFPLFMNVVGKAAGAAVEWGTKRILDATVRCPNGCTVFVKKIPNYADAAFECYKCHAKFIDQYSCATNRTVNRDLSLTASHAKNFRWDVNRTF